MVVWLFLAVPWVCLRFVIVVFPDHTHFLFMIEKLPFKTKFEALGGRIFQELVIRLSAQLNTKQILNMFLNVFLAFPCGNGLYFNFSVISLKIVPK